MKFKEIKSGYIMEAEEGTAQYDALLSAPEYEFFVEVDDTEEPGASEGTEEQIEEKTEEPKEEGKKKTTKK